MSRLLLLPLGNVHLSIRRGLIHFEGRGDGGKDCYSRRDETVRATVPLSPGTRFSSLSPPSPTSSSCNQPRARRIGPRPNDRTANIWQLRNMSLHLIIAVNTGRTRRVATGGESDEIRSRPRAPAWGKFRFTPPPPSSHLLHPRSHTERYTLLL